MPKTYLNELTLKLTKNHDFVSKKITSTNDAYNYIKQFYHDDIEIYESFFILLLNRAMKTIGYAKISQGGCAGTVIDSKIIAKYCVDSLADGVILAHNHPSGNTKPSSQDIDMTKKIKDGLALLDCSVRDHIILASDSYFSFVDEGYI